MINILKRVLGNTEGVKVSQLQRLEELYEKQVEEGLLISGELIDELVALSHELNREIALYLNRKGQVLTVALGEQDQVTLEEISQRRGSGRLSKIRCIHTHPNSSGCLSAVDLHSLHQLRFDCIAAIGVTDGQCGDIWVAFINPEEKTKVLNYGPFNRNSILKFDFLRVIEEIEKKFNKNFQANLSENDREKALLVGIEFTEQKSNLWDAEESLAELEGLAKAAGAVVVDKVYQRRNRPDSTYYIGSGLVKRLKLKCYALKVDLVVIDGELSGSQQRNLEKSLGVKVIDRTALILDIFAQRAKSKEGKLQVELAQLEYLLPRLAGGVELGLSRLGGGIGTRGPGESKLEQDRRRLRKRITELKKELQKLEEQRALLKRSRKDGTPVVALVGYTNSGKSTLRFRLLQKYASHPVDLQQEDKGTNQLFATLDPTVRGIILPNGTPVLLADTVGFIQRLPHKLVAAFKATLEEVVDADLLLHVVDVSNPNYEQQIIAVDQVLAELGVLDKKTILVYNKIDLVSEEQIYFNPYNYPSVEISALTGQGLTKLVEEMQKILGANRLKIRLAIPYNQAKLVAFIYQEGKVNNICYENDFIILDTEVNPNIYNMVRKYII